MFSGGPGSSVSPNKGSNVPRYLQTTFSHQTKTAAKNADKSNVHSYQLNRVRPTKQQRKAEDQLLQSQQLNSMTIQVQPTQRNEENSYDDL